MKFDFAQNREVKTLSDVPENFRCFYEEHVDGEGDAAQKSYKLSDNSIVMNAVNAITGLNTALSAARQDVDAAKKAQVDLGPLKDYGDDPKTIAENIAKKIKVTEERSGQDVKSQVDAIKKELAEAHANQAGQYQTTIANLTTQLDNHMIDSAITQACPHVNNAPALLVAPFARKRIKIVVDPETKERSIVPLARDGNSTMYSMDPNRAGEKASIVELLTDMSNDPELRPIFPSPNRGGGGADDSAGIPRGRKKNLDDMSSNDMIAEGLNELGKK